MKGGHTTGGPPWWHAESGREQSMPPYSSFQEKLVEAGYVSLPRPLKEALNTDEQKRDQALRGVFSTWRCSPSLPVETRLYPPEAGFSPRTGTMNGQRIQRQ